LKNWKDHYNTFPALAQRTDYLRQVGKTVNGETIDDFQVEIIINSIVNYLEINSNDNVLDLGCGNGMITKEISAHCRNIVGVDFSHPLIEIASIAHFAANSSYINKSILDIRETDFNHKFTKVFMYEALQHFTANQFDKILKLIRNVSTPNVKVLLGSIPDKSKLWQYYDTYERKVDFFKRKIFNDEAIGVWWKKRKIVKICRANNFNIRFFNQNEGLYTSHYRFDVVLSLIQKKNV